MIIIFRVRLDHPYRQRKMKSVLYNIFATGFFATNSSWLSILDACELSHAISFSIKLLFSSGRLWGHMQVLQEVSSIDSNGNVVVIKFTATSLCKFCTSDIIGTEVLI